MTSATAPPLAGYNYITFWATRVYALYESEVTLHYKTRAGTETHLRFPLQSLNPAYSNVRLFREPFVAGIHLCIWAPALAALYASLAYFVFGKGPEPSLVVVTAAFFLLGVVLAIVNRRRLSAASFHYRAGGHAFDVMSIQGKTADADRFVDQTVDRIRGVAGGV
jgi:hypothetical protein